MRRFRSEFIPLRERRHHVRIWGDDAAPTVFFCTDGAMSAPRSNSLSMRCKELARRRAGLARIWPVAMERRRLLFNDYIADLDALLEHYSPRQPAQIVGHSLGGIVASLYAGIRPERVSRFANLEGFGLWVSPPGETPAVSEHGCNRSGTTMRRSALMPIPENMPIDYARTIRA